VERTLSAELALTAPHRAAALSRRRMRAIKGCAGVLVLLAAWQLSVPLVGLGPYFYPAPVDVAAAFADLVRKGILPV
jgi:NitT/TauT family transport system permease protein/taurine transport system permease protein